MAALPIEERRLPPWPSASSVPSFVTIAARLPSVRRRPTRSPSRSPGKVMCGAQAIFSSWNGSSISSSTLSKSSVRTPTVTSMESPASLVSPGSIAVAVEALCAPR